MISMVRVNRKKYKRKKIGRPLGSGPWGEPTKQMSIPNSVVPLVVDLLADFINANGLDVKARKQLNDIEERCHGRKPKKARKMRKVKRVLPLSQRQMASSGGKTRAKLLSPARRSEIARKAAKLRWSKR